MFKSFNIGRKLFVSFIAILLLLTTLSTVSYINFSKLNNANALNEHTYKVFLELRDIMASMVNMETGQRGFSVTGDEKFLEPFNQGKASFDTHYNSAKKLISNTALQQNLDKIKNLEEQWINTAEKSIKLRRDVAQGKASIEDVVKLEDTAEGKKYMDEIREVISHSNDIESSILEERLANSEALQNLMKVTLIFGTIIACILALTIAYLISRSITKPIGKLTDLAKRIATGDMDVDIKVNSKDEIGLLSEAFGSLVGSVKELVYDMNKLTEHAVKGEINVRAEGDKHSGEFRKIIEGVNNTLDAVIEPVNEAAEVLNEMSKGNLGKNVVGNYKGEHAQIKNALNDTINTIRSYILEITETLNEIASGNLKIKITREYRGDFNAIKESINFILSSLNEVLGEINLATEQVAESSKQVSASSQALSEAATEQAGSVQEITSSMAEVSEQTKNNAVNAGEASELANVAKKNAVSGNGQMKEMLNAMEEINSASNNISKIIKVIDEIAFQTNILALNAAVEAARAGQHGKGFAVVAEEVRNLAARSASAAKETTAMIEGSMSKVEIGTKIAKETAGALNKIVEDVSKATELVDEIAVASGSQSTGIQQINLGVDEVAKVIQDISATAEESAAASEELFSQAEMLNELVNKFKLTKK